MKTKWETILPVEAGHEMNQNEKDWMTDWVEFHREHSYWHKFMSLCSWIAYMQPKFQVSNSSGIGSVFRFVCFCGAKHDVADVDTW